MAHLKRALTACKCSRVFQPEEILAKDWAALTEADMARITRCGCGRPAVKSCILRSTRLFPRRISGAGAAPCPAGTEHPRACSPTPACGRVLRVKGFVEENGQWVELNATADGLTASPLAQGQQVLIVIGEGLDKAAIEQKLRN